MSDDRPPEIPMPDSVVECDRMLGDAAMILEVQRNRGNTIGLSRIRHTIDRLLDTRLHFTGPPVCSSPECGRVKSRFGSAVYLCGECDMRACENNDCERRVLSLNNLHCNPCRGVTRSAPWFPPGSVEPSEGDEGPY